MTTQISDKELEKRERRRLYAIEYRKQNAEKIKARHDERMLSDPDYVSRYLAKQEKRKHLYQESHAEAVKVRQERRVQLAIAREDRERERHRKVKQKYREENRELYNARMREYNAKNRDEINAKRREKWHSDLKYRSRQFYTGIKANYGVTQEQYVDLYISHGGRCSVCGLSENQIVRGLVLDHCHVTGLVRGLLCKDCNTGLGHFRDDIQLLHKAIEYLKRS